MTGRSLRVSGYGARVRLDVPVGLPPGDLRRHVAPELRIEESDAGPPDLLLTRWDGVYHLVLGERRYGPYHTDAAAFRGVSNAIHFIVGKRSPMTFVHAGAIEIDGAAVIFPGRSRWGKSTLVASLVDQGCGYLSDEYAVLTPEGSVLPLSKPIRLRREGGGVELKIPARAVGAPGGLPCAAMILTRYEEGVQWDPEPLTPGFAMLGALPAALQSRDAPEQVIEALMAVVQRAANYRGARGDAEPTLNALRHLIRAERFQAHAPVG